MSRPLASAWLASGPGKLTNEILEVETKHLPSCPPCPEEMSATSVLPYPKHIDDDGYVTTLHLIPPEKHASLACKCHGKPHVFPDDRRPISVEQRHPNATEQQSIYSYSRNSRSVSILDHCSLATVQGGNQQAKFAEYHEPFSYDRCSPELCRSKPYTTHRASPQLRELHVV